MLSAIPFDQNDGRYTVCLNGQWKFSLVDANDIEVLSEFYKKDYDVEKWADITVPSNWEMQGFEEPHYFHPDTSKAGLYRKEITLPEEWKDRQVIVHFEAVSFGYSLYVNEEKVGSFQQAFLPCQFDITPYVNYDKPNIIALKVYRDHDAIDFDCNDAWALSGIFRDVYIFSPDRYHIDRCSVDTKLNTENQSATIEGQMEIRVFQHNHNTLSLDPNDLVKPLAVKLLLKDADGKIVADRTEDVAWLTPRVVPTHRFRISIGNARYWNAEEPYLYDLSMTLMSEGKQVHHITQKVGLREISTEGGILKVNGRRIKLRGVCRHEIQPFVGRALRQEHWLEDIKLMKECNINAVRCSHYPPHPRFLELCDEYGFYVLDEVPIGFGEKRQNDPVMLGEMLSRAQRTVERDRNHPCVIIWDIGNENPLYGLQERAAKLVKLTDPTRPLLYPGENFLGLGKSFASGSAEFIDILARHYPHNEEIQSDLEDDNIRKPLVYTEINHSVDTAFSDFKTKCDMIEENDKLAGCFIWEWVDQGLARKVNGREVVDSYEDISLVRGKHTILSGDVWLDDNTILDSHGPDGTEGIVYADRRRQTDYYETRKLYSPVKIERDYFSVDSDGRAEFTVENRYNFTDLNKLTGRWKLIVDGKVSVDGQLPLDCKPHKKQICEIEVRPFKIGQNDVMLQVLFEDTKGTAIYERTLVVENSRVDWLTKAEKQNLNLRSKEPWCVVDEKGMPVIKNSKGEELLRGCSARIGRKPTMAEQKTYPRMELAIWKPAVLTDFEVVQRTEEVQFGQLTVRTKTQYKNPDNDKQTVHADIAYTINELGWVDIEYTLTPDSEEGALLEVGLGWEIQNAEKISWLGDGPYACYPYKNELAERGIYSIAPGDPFFDGNRMNVELVDIAYPNGQIGIVTNGTNFGWEKQGDGKVIIYQNQKVASLGTKFKFPRQVLRSSELGGVKGHLRFYLLGDERDGIFGDIFD